MAYTRVSAACLLALASCAQAHFKLLAPPSIGFVDDTEGTAPCGGPGPDYSKDKITEFHVAGQPIALVSTHPESRWLFRATFEESGKGDWERIYPIVQQNGAGDFCIPTVTAPDAWIGRTGVLGVAVDGPDGMLYQCSTVRFVEGREDAGSDCKNGTRVTASVVQDDSLSGLASATITPGSASATESSPASTSSASGDNDNAGSRPLAQPGLAFGLCAVLAAFFY